MKIKIGRANKLKKLHNTPGFSYELDGCIAKHYTLGCSSVSNKNICIAYVYFPNTGNLFTESFMNGYINFMIGDFEKCMQVYDNPTIHLFIHVENGIKLKFMNMPKLSLQYTLYKKTGLSKVYLLISNQNFVVNIVADLIANTARTLGGNFNTFHYDSSNKWLSILKENLRLINMTDNDIEMVLSDLDLLRLEM